MNRVSALLVDDDSKLGKLLTEYLGKNDVDVTAALDGERGLALLATKRFDLVLLDLMLPRVDGLEVLKRIRAGDRKEVPVLMLTARGDDVDKVVGLEMGADDYLAKPFNPRELLARIRALTRRAALGPVSAGDHIKSGDLDIDLPAREVRLDGKRVVLTNFEFELLATLAKSAGRVLSRDQLMDGLKGEAFETFDRSIDVHVSRLRAKLEKDPKSPRHIKTVRGVGYLFARDE